MVSSLVAVCFRIMSADRTTTARLWVCLLLSDDRLQLVGYQHHSQPRFCINTSLTRYRLSVHPGCIEAFNELKLGKNGTKYIIYKISDDLKEIVVDEVSKETDYDVFREKLQNAKEKNGKSRPSYAVYDVAFELGEGEGHRLVGTHLDTGHED